ncbi:cell division protein FtsZ, partial [Synechococcus sp. CS-1324]|nr:cell division protein FtsZ [Synechococcus sp. CS-1324]
MELENLFRLINDSATDSICELAKICGRDIKRDYAGADLSKVDLSGADLSEADFTYADFTGANLAGANLTGANLKGAVFANADLQGAILTNAIIEDADFTNALLDADALRSRPGGRYANNEQIVGHISDTRIDVDCPAFQSIRKPDSELADGELEWKFYQDDHPRISVFGVGGGGSNAVNHMIASDLQGVGYRVLNTDAKGLLLSTAKQRLQLGKKLTRGLGSGGNPVIGQKAAEESRAELAQALQGTDLLFIAVGMGGGTGTGAASIIAEVAKEVGALTVAIVTKPFSFEGRKRQRQAEEGIARLAEHVDTLILIPNDRLRESIAGAPLQEAFRAADDVLRQGVKGISDIITKPGLVNVDFADVRSVMTMAGTALLGIGVGSGRSRA